MSRHFTATVLLEQYWPLDIDALASAVRKRFPEIGEVEGVAGQAEGMDSGLLRIEGGNVVVTSIASALPVDQLSPQLKVLRGWDSAPALLRQRAQITISCGGRLPGLEGAEAHAAVVHFVAAAVTDVAPAVAVFWQRGYALTEPKAFASASGKLLDGHMPLSTWVSFANVVPRGFRAEDATGMVSYGLRPFIGRELELAPRPCTPREAYATISAVSRRILDTGISLRDGMKLERLGDAGPDLVVRERTYWLRRDLSAYVLVAADSVVDRETLKPRELPAA